MQFTKQYTVDIGSFARRLTEIRFRFPKIQLRSPNIFEVLTTEARDLGDLAGPIRREQLKMLILEKGAILRSMVYLAVASQKPTEEVMNWTDIKSQALGLGMTVRIIDRHDELVLHAPPAYSRESITEWFVNRYIRAEGANHRFKQDWIVSPGPLARIEITVPELAHGSMRQMRTEQSDRPGEGSVGAVVAIA